MTTEEIVDAARAAGFSSSEMFLRLPAFKRLIESAAAAEREACAKIADAEIAKHPPGAPFNQYQSGIFTAAEHIAEAIRARGNQ